VDIPFASKYSALFIGKAIVNNYLPISYLKGSNIKQLSPGLVTKIVLEALSTVQEGLGAEKTSQSIKDSNIDVSELTGKSKEELVQAASKVSDHPTSTSCCFPTLTTNNINKPKQSYNGLVQVFETL